jgi:thymidylate synthase
MNNLDDLPGRYVKNLYNFSDDGHTWRGGYGPRIRRFDGTLGQYNVGYRQVRERPGHWTIDQLKYAIQTLQKDPSSRQAVINIADPVKDYYDSNFPRQEVVLQTLDVPCTRSLHFMMSPDGKLDLYTHMRSNDLIWGLSAVNVFNFTLMQQYIAEILGVSVGSYYHIADNLHYYENFEYMVYSFAGYEDSYGQWFDMQQTPPAFNVKDLEELDDFAETIYLYETSLYFEKEDKASLFDRQRRVVEEFRNKVPFFADWLSVFHLWWAKKGYYNPQDVIFSNRALVKHKKNVIEAQRKQQKE